MAQVAHRALWPVEVELQLLVGAVADGGEDGRLVVSDARAAKTISVYQGHTAPVTGLAVHPQAEHLMSGSLDAAVLRWRAAAATVQPVTLQDHPGGVWFAHYSPEGTWLASGGKGGGITLWARSLAPARFPFQSRSGSFWDAAFAPDGSVHAVLKRGEHVLLYRSTDAGRSWHELPALREHESAPNWQPGAGGMCLHTILQAPNNPDRFYIAISAAGAFRTDDGGKSWRPINHGLHSGQIPDPDADVGHCVHRLALHRDRPDVLFMQKHWDVMRSDDAGESWYEISGDLPTDFGFPIDVHAHEPDTVYLVPIHSDEQHYPPEGKLRVYRSRVGGNEWEPLTKGLPQENCYVNVLRDAMAVDDLDDCGIYFGTTGGDVYVSPDSGDTWRPIVNNLPSVLSVEVQTLP